jgi:glutamine synthetase adenylyltransferase
MRRRIEKERTPVGKQLLAIKTGAGGLIDAEFVAQTLCLANGWHEPNTLRTLLLAREKKVLPGTSADLLIDNYRQLRRVEGILRRWSYAGETVLPDDAAPLYRVAVRCGYTAAEHFLKAVADCRAAIRRVYGEIMDAA